MNQIYVFLIRNDVWIYMLCGLGIIWYLNEFVRGSSALGRAAFSLERERATKRRGSALLFLLIFGVVASSVAYTNVKIKPQLPLSLLKPPTPTPNPFSPALSDPIIVETPTSRPRPTPTLVLAPTATLLFELAPTVDAIDESDNFEMETLREGCGGNLDITQPASGTTIRGGTSIFGTASGTEFSAYGIELSGPETGDDWFQLTLPDPSTPVGNGFLGTADLSGWQEGIYQMRLVTFSNLNTRIATCTINIGLRAP